MYCGISDSLQTPTIAHRRYRSWILTPFCHLPNVSDNCELRDRLVVVAYQFTTRERWSRENKDRVSKFEQCQRPNEETDAQRGCTSKVQ
jgi:hypothetical protein